MISRFERGKRSECFNFLCVVFVFLGKAFIPLFEKFPSCTTVCVCVCVCVCVLGIFAKHGEEDVAEERKKITSKKR